MLIGQKKDVIFYACLGGLTVGVFFIIQGLFVTGEAIGADKFSIGTNLIVVFGGVAVAFVANRRWKCKCGHREGNHNRKKVGCDKCECIHFTRFHKELKTGN